uniref:Uncharacterized protein n=1 Tax=Strix occidentalis caurina TaxID=311401 RepID=A0A8D0FKJ3_STROC
MHKAFWDSLEEQLSASPPVYTGNPALLLLLLPRHNQLRSQIEEALGRELVQQAAERGALGVRGLTMDVLGTMARPRAPHEVRKYEACKAPQPQLSCSGGETFRVLGLMKMDILNFTIQSLGTHLQEHNVPYEGKKFQELLDKLPCKLLGKGEENCHFYRCLTDESNPSESWRTPGSLPQGSSLTLSVLNRGDVNLLCWEPGQKEYPETLFRDQARLQEEQAQVNQFTIRAAVLLVTRAMCGSTFCGSPAFVARLKWVTKRPSALGRQQDSRSYPACTTATWASPKGQIKTITVKGNAVWHITGESLSLSNSTLKPLCAPRPQLWFRPVTLERPGQL